MKAVALGVVAVVVVACGGTIGSSDGGVDGGPGADAAQDAGYLACFDSSGTLDASLKVCQSDPDCVIEQESVDCCGTILYVGVAASSVASFTACEASWEAHFPPCGCASNQTRTEDGKTSTQGSDAGAPAVRCSGGACMTYTP
jgi:hypothetical protein